MKMPITFEDFKSNPLASIAFVLVIAVGFLFIELRESHELQAKTQNERILKMEEEISEYKEDVYKLREELLKCLDLNQ